MSSQAFFESTILYLEILGVGAIVVGFAAATVLTLRAWIRSRDGAAAFQMLRRSFGGVILLGLEILVAADIVKTVTSTPSLTDAAILALIVLIRTVLSFSLQVEIDGVAPWRRAFVTGPEVLANSVKQARAD